MRTPKTYVPLLLLLLALLQTPNARAQTPHAAARPQQFAAANPEDRAAFRKLADEYFAALAAKNLDAATALWDTSSPNFRLHKDWLKATFVSRPSVTTRVIEVTQSPGTDGHAVVRVQVETNAYAPSSVPEAETLVRTLELVRSGAGWKVWDDAAAERELALRLLDAPDDAARERLLADKPDLNRGRLAGAVVNQSLRLFMRSEFKRSLEASVYARRVAEAADAQAWVGMASLYAGLAQVTIGQYAPAAESLELARRLHEQLGDRPMLARSLNGLGMFHYYQGQYEPSLKRYREALKVAEAAGDLRMQADAERGVGIVHSLQGDYDLALAHYDRSIALFTQSGDDLYIAHVLFQVSIIKRSQGDLASALEADLRCKKLYEAAGHRQGLANALGNIGVVHFMQGDYEGALSHYLKSVAIHEEIGSRQGTAAALHNIALVYKRQGNYPLALEHLRRGLKLMEELNDKTRVATLLINMANVQFHLGDTGSAEQSYLKSIAISEPAGLKAQLAHAYSNLGHLYYRLGKYAEAAERLKKSLALHQAMGERPEEARTLAALALVESESGEREAARADAGRAAALAAQMQMAQLTWEVALVEGEVRRRTGDDEGARRAFEQSIAAVEAMRSRVGGDELQQALFFEDKTRPYEALVEIAVSRGEPAEALAYAERTKARALLDVIRDGRRRHTTGMSEEETRRERDLTQAVTATAAKLAREKSRPQADAKRVAVLEESLRSARLEYEAFETGLYATHSSLKVARGEAHPLRTDELASLVESAGDALLEYVVTEKQTFLFVVTRSSGAPSIKVFAINVGEKELGARVEKFRSQLAQRGLGYGQQARELYDLLLKPASEALRGRASLVFVPDGPLWELPFHALQPAAGRFLLEDAAVSYAPSLTVLREQRGRRPSARAGTRTLLAFGDPSPEATLRTSARTQPVALSSELAPLPEAARQVRALARLYGPAGARVYTGAEAREEYVKAEAGRYRVVQFATHGVLDNASPMYSHLVLAPGQGDEDGRLEAWEMMNLDLKADLVVLSACETARGRVGAGEGVIGMSWALFVAGAPAAVVSQWKVDSASTTELMLGFHKNLRAASGGAPAKAEALRRAALSLMRTPEYRHPYYWAGFIVVGDAR